MIDFYELAKENHATTYFLLASLVSTKNPIQEEVGDELGIGFNASEFIVGSWVVLSVNEEPFMHWIEFLLFDSNSAMTLPKHCQKIPHTFHFHT